MSKSKRTGTQLKPQSESSIGGRQSKRMSIVTVVMMVEFMLTFTHERELHSKDWETIA